MGAEQSNIPNGDVFLPAGTFAIDSDGPSSFPNSLSRKSRAQSTSQLSNGTNALSPSTTQRTRHSLSYLPPDAIISRLSPRQPHETIENPQRSSTACTSPVRQVTRSASISAAPQSGGIVVVCQGPTKSSLRSAESLDFSATAGKRSDMAAAMELKKLRNVPSFSPLLPNSGVLLEEMMKGSGRQFRILSPSMETTKIIPLVNSYGHHLKQCADVAYERQVKITGMQNKLDYEVKRLFDDLKLRESGATPKSPKNTQKPKDGHVSNAKICVAGSKQVDTVVLLTSQISGLIDQCCSGMDKLVIDLNLLNETLPPGKHLPELKIKLPKIS